MRGIDEKTRTTLIITGETEERSKTKAKANGLYHQPRRS